MPVLHPSTASSLALMQRLFSTGKHYHTATPQPLEKEKAISQKIQSGGSNAAAKYTTIHF